MLSFASAGSPGINPACADVTLRVVPRPCWQVLHPNAQYTYVLEITVRITLCITEQESTLCNDLTAALSLTSSDTGTQLWNRQPVTCNHWQHQGTADMSNSLDSCFMAELHHTYASEREEKSTPVGVGHGKPWTDQWRRNKEAAYRRR